MVIGQSLRRSSGALITCAILAACDRQARLVELPPPEVLVAPPVQRDVIDYFETTGHVAPVDLVEIRPRVSGYLTKVNFVDGAEVKAGDVLFEIDPRPYEAAVMRAEADVAKCNAELRNAEAEVARTQRLMAERATSTREVETSVTRKSTTEANLLSAKADLQDAKRDLEFAHVVAPISGRVSRPAVTVGNLVQGGIGMSTLLTTLVSTDPMYVYFDADERTMLRTRASARDAKQVQSDAAAEVRVLAIPMQIGLANEQGYSRTGKIDFIDNHVDPTTGTIQVRGVFENADRNLVAGMFVRVRVPIETMSGALLVSDRAIGTDQSSKYVLVVNDQDVVEYRGIGVGAESEGMRVVQNGLRPGERVITGGMQRVRPGIRVNARVHDDAPATAQASANP